MYSGTAINGVANVNVCAIGLMRFGSCKPNIEIRPTDARMPPAAPTVENINPIRAPQASNSQGDAVTSAISKYIFRLQYSRDVREQYTDFPGLLMC
jgi:hypothetical protein